MCQVGALGAAGKYACLPRNRMVARRDRDTVRVDMGERHEQIVPAVAGDVADRGRCGGIEGRVGFTQAEGRGAMGDPARLKGPSLTVARNGFAGSVVTRSW